MIIESLNARNGDATVIRHTGPNGPVTGLIDGGPTGVYRASIIDALAAHDITPASGILDWLAVSHVDSDHIGGIIRVLGAGYTLGRALFNTPSTFPQLGVAPASARAPTANLEQTIATLSTRMPAGVNTASIGQGQTLLNLILARPDGTQLLNANLGRRLLTTDLIDIDGLQLTVLGPSQERLDALLAKWADEITPASAEHVDTSITNLSSLTFLAEAERQSAVFTGDGLEDDVVAGLRLVGRNLPMEVDLLKLPHHGSNSAANPDSLLRGEGLIENVLARHYVVSANGASTNPTPATLDRIAALGRECTVWFPAPKKPDGSTPDQYYAGVVDEFTARVDAQQVPVTIRVGDGAPLTIDLAN